ncbi:hypothetical protein GQ464_011780 [Rhodocaloribacter litoris]|uniref:hypothetical protein n=1 Tax=Rhodocaloribacter litoris TaxID=2558931 RepID=UPI00141FBD38|nr:hypothetical protein [Rhodocaloribacter litoris]QXD14136.1 hypothetical protein GQ464_011780 [Rhodocaloribacter litoris]
MRNLTYVVVLLLTVGATSGPARAQQDIFAESTPEERAALLTDYLTELLALTDSTQIEQVRQINLTYARKNETVIMSNDRRLAKLKALRALNEQKDKELRRVLTDAQFATYQRNKEQLKQELKKRMKARREGSQ